MPVREDYIRPVGESGLLLELLGEQAALREIEARIAQELRKALAPSSSSACERMLQYLEINPFHLSQSAARVENAIASAQLE